MRRQLGVLHGHHAEADEAAGGLFHHRAIALFTAWPRAARLRLDPVRRSSGIGESTWVVIPAVSIAPSRRLRPIICSSCAGDSMRTTGNSIPLPMNSSSCSVLVGNYVPAHSGEVRSVAPRFVGEDGSGRDALAPPEAVPGRSRATGGRSGTLSRHRRPSRLADNVTLDEAGEPSATFASLSEANVDLDTNACAECDVVHIARAPGARPSLNQRLPLPRTAQAPRMDAPPVSHACGVGNAPSTASHLRKGPRHPRLRGGRGADRSPARAADPRSPRECGAPRRRRRHDRR